MEIYLGILCAILFCIGLFVFGIRLLKFAISVWWAILPLAGAWLFGPIGFMSGVGVSIIGVTIIFVLKAVFGLTFSIFKSTDRKNEDASKDKIVS